MIWLILFFLQIAYAASPYSDLLDLPKKMPEEMKSVIEKDFERLSSCEFIDTTPLFNEIFSLNENKNLDPNWFKKRITKVNADPRLNVDASFGNGLRFHLFPRTCGVESKADTLTIGPFYFAGTQSDRISTLIHEARHGDGCSHRNYPGDFICSDDLPVPSKEVCNGTSDGQCDETYKGAYGTQMIFLVNYARNCTNDQKEKEKIKFKAFSMFNKILMIDDRKKLISDLFSVEEAERFKKQTLRLADPLSTILLLNEIEDKVSGKTSNCPAN